MRPSQLMELTARSLGSLTWLEYGIKGIKTLESLREDFLIR